MLEQKQHLLDYVTGLADDAMVMGQRLSEWCSKAPFLEEDLALANVALDFLGRAQLLYGYATELHNADNDAEPIDIDSLPFLRDARDYKNTLIHELPIGDFGFTIARQFLIDTFATYFMAALSKSTDLTLSGIAGKAIKETQYHLRRSQSWVLRLGDGTEQSHQRIQAAFDQLWGYTDELFEMSEAETALLSAGVAVDKTLFKKAWLNNVTSTLEQATLQIPDDDWRIRGGRDGVHTEHLGYLLAEMQYLPRTYPGLNW